MGGNKASSKYKILSGQFFCNTQNNNGLTVIIKKALAQNMKFYINTDYKHPAKL
jgi:hypothetical protein